MTALDTNILVYAHRSEMPWHGAADRCITELANSGASWAIPWPCIHEFIAIVTNPRIFRTPTPMLDALKQVDFWMESPSLLLLGELNGYWDNLKQSLISGKVVGAKTHDARVFAICRQHGVKTLWSADRDFSRFAGIEIVNPLLKLPGSRPQTM